MKAKEGLDVAARIGHRLTHQAIWDGPRASWEIQAVDRSSADGRRSRAESAGPTLYQGTSGIAWYLGELHRATGEAELRRTAAGALEHALAAAAELPSASFGFYSGRVGIAWVAAHLAAAFDESAWAERAWGLLEPLIGHEAQDRGIDVIGGAAGAIPALLEIAALLERGEPFEMARRLGDQLIARAHREPAGWSWSTIGNSAVRYLNGLAHGASGVGLALLELARATGDGRYRFAAEMAFLYERRWFDAEHDNWPDFRNKAIGDYVYYGRSDELRELVTQDLAPPYELSFMSAWCHGAPGVGLARLRAFELTGQALYRDEARAALPATRRSVEGDALLQSNFSLCHGIGGNCETLLLAAEILGDDTLREPCFEAARHGREVYEEAGRPWSCGTVSSALDPSLMLGEAGIGAFYLRLARPETPSPLLLRPVHRGGEPEPDAEGYAALAREAVDGYFATTLTAWSRLEPPGPELEPAAPGPEPLERSPVEAAWDGLRDWAETRDDTRRPLVDDAFELDRSRYELTLEQTDFTREFLRGLARPEWEHVDPRSARFEIALGGRLASTEYDWSGWLAGGADAAPEEEDAWFLLLPVGHVVRIRQMGLLATLVLDALDTPATLDEILAHTAETIPGATPAEISAKVLPQLEELYRANLVDVADSPPRA